MRWFEREKRKKTEIYTSVIKRIPEGKKGYLNSTQIFQRCVTENAREIGITKNNLAREILNPAKCIERNPNSPREYIRNSPSQEICNGCPFEEGCVIIAKK